MKDTMWSYAVMLLWFSEAWSSKPGSFQSTTEITSTSPPAYNEHRNLFFNQGSAVNLTCGDKTWNTAIFVTWNITLKNKNCRISFLHDGSSTDLCNDGKSLQNTSDQSYLHIPNFSPEDVGIYKCFLPYKGGSDAVTINVSLTVPPKISLKVRHKGNRTELVCTAEGGIPAANISWIPARNTSSAKELHLPGLVKSTLVLDEGEDAENLSCYITHPCWENGKLLQEYETEGRIPWVHILSIVVLTVFLASLIFIAQKKLRMLRPCQPDIDPSSKSPPTEDVEEVEPYASYVQRENTIYNSSADLFA